MVEIDIHLSSDGELVVTHDLANRLPLSDIRRLDPRIPTLAECVTRARRLSMLVNVEIKNLPRRYAGIEETVVRTLERLDAAGDVLVSSFDHESVVAIRQLCDTVATAVLTEARLYDPVAYLNRLDADAYHPAASVPDRGAIQAIRASGRGVNVWTENDPRRMRRLIEAGVTGIVTDFPDRLRDVIDVRR
jgi:glycerophosphoryl diester phosphodiesterase